LDVEAWTGLTVKEAILAAADRDIWRRIMVQPFLGFRMAK